MPTKTPSGHLNVYDEFEDPGRGSKTLEGNGFNNNPIVLDTAVFTEHNKDGTHKSEVIDGANLKSTVADGSTIEQDSSTKKLKVKDGGVTAAKLAVDAVETAKIKDGNVTAAKLATDAVETAKIKDGNVTAAKLATDAVETAKIKDANVTTEKLEYKEYIARLSQAATGDPVATVIKTTLGVTLTWYRADTGSYQADLTSLSVSKVDLKLTASPATGVVHFLLGRPLQLGGDVGITLATYNTSFALADSMMSDDSITIRVYP